MKWIIQTLLLGLFTFSTMAENSDSPIHWGRFRFPSVDNDKKSFIFDVGVGRMTTMDADIRETKRAGADYYDRRSEYEKYLQRYSLSEFGLGADSLLSAHIEKQWNFLTFKLNMSYFSQEASSVAEKEKLALEIEDVNFNGESYEHMLIPQGREYDTTLKGGIIEPLLIFTPCHFTLGNNMVFITPMAFAGLYSFGGRFNIDAGEAERLTTYEAHPYPYVVGGEGEGWVGLGFPQFGFGGEVIFELIPDLYLGVELLTSTLDWQGDTSDIGVSVRHDKDLDVDFSNISLNTTLRWTLSKKWDALLGLRYQAISSDAEINAKVRTEEERALLKEKYDKQASFDIKAIWLYGGFQF